jgi:hypothetical protein
VVAAARSDEDFGELARTPGWMSNAPDPAQRVWSDDYSNIVDAVIRKLSEMKGESNLQQERMMTDDPPSPTDKLTRAFLVADAYSSVLPAHRRFHQ